MEGVVNHAAAMRGRRVLVTGHTGFKGAWLSEWLIASGAKVTGIALPPESDDALFSRLRLAERLDHIVCDVRDRASLAAAVRRADPEVVFHMAAQALVRRSYREPLATWETNVTGTLNLLEALREVAPGRRMVVVVVTSDKVYRNREWEFSYREHDELGGHDPYSASKAACEIAVGSWRDSFAAEAGVAVATARAGNVIGGGDVCEDRIVPDCYRAWGRGEAVGLRNPRSTRPWQHVLEPLSGYLALAARLGSGDAIDACNFGPLGEGSRTVEELVRALAAFDVGRRWNVVGPAPEHESRSLSLSIDRAHRVLGWSPRLNFAETVEWTNAGYVAADIVRVVERQLADYAARRPNRESRKDKTDA